ncbi:hypothetical protein BGX28_004175 [Mortierella sp. GBA30]|nr:hypothetical protein BGX28_004175 [Mortierella sp. GBA30]
MLGSNSSSLFSSSSSTSTQSSTTTTTTTATTTTTTTKITTMSTPVEGVEEESPKLNNKGSRAFPSIVRRSEINIARRRRRQDTGDRAPFSSTPSSTSDSITHVAPHNVNDDTYFQEGKGPQLMDLRFPGVIQPIEIEHTFGVYNTVYSQTPYTLKWIVPARTAELLEYTENRLRLMADKSIDWALHGSLKENHKTFLAKMLVELVMDHTLEPVSVLSRNVPAETKFLITQIHERVPNAFYRLKIQMVVVEVQEDSTAQDQLRRDQASPPFSATRPSHGDYMEGWDFPSGGKIIDRYESITRRFWVSSGAL